MRKKLVFLLIFCALLTVACSKKNKSNSEIKNKSATTQTNNNAKTQKDENSNVYSSAFDKEKIDELINDSDYISRVRISTTSDEAIESNFLKDYKGDLSLVDITLPKSLSPNKEYLIFYKDSDNGEIMPTDKNESFIEILDENDGNLNYIEKEFGTYSDSSKTQNKVKEN